MVNEILPTRFGAGEALRFFSVTPHVKWAVRNRAKIFFVNVTVDNAAVDEIIPPPALGQGIHTTCEKKMCPPPRCGEVEKFERNSKIFRHW